MKVKSSGADLAFDIINTALLFLLLLIVAYPLYFIVIASLSTPNLVATGQVLFFPRGLTLVGYQKVLGYGMIWLGYRNSIFYSLGGAFLSVSLTMMAGYVFTRRDLAGRNFLLALFVIPMFFGGGLIPTYLVVRSLNMLNNPMTLVIMGCVSMYNIIIARTFIDSNIPSEMLEAARIDGCNNVQYFFKIILPLSKAVIAVLTVFALVGQWNSYFNALIYINSRNLYPLQLVLREILNAQTEMMRQLQVGTVNSNDMQQIYLAESMKYGIIIVSSLPMLMIYPFAQKYFVKGVMIGSVKG